MRASALEFIINHAGPSDTRFNVLIANGVKILDEGSIERILNRFARNAKEAPYKTMYAVADLMDNANMTHDQRNRAWKLHQALGNNPVTLIGVLRHEFGVDPKTLPDFGSTERPAGVTPQ